MTCRGLTFLLSDQPATRGLAVAALFSLGAVSSEGRGQERPEPSVEPPSTLSTKPVAAETQDDQVNTVLDVIVVEGTRHGFVAPNVTTASKTETPLIETPQSVSVITAAQLEAQMPQSVEQALRYNSGIVSESFSNDLNANFGTVRGFQVQPLLAGLPLFSGAYANWRLDPYGLDQIELVRGPSSALFGSNPPGGLINSRPKAASSSEIREVVVQGGAPARGQAQFDVGGRVAAMPDWSYRVVGLGRMSDTEVDFTRDNRVFVAPSFSWTPSTDTTVRVFANLQRDWKNTGAEFWPAEGTVLPNLNGVIPRNRFVSEPRFDGTTNRQYLVGYQFEHRFADQMQLRQKLHLGHLQSDARGAFNLGWDWLDPSKRRVARLAHSTAERVSGVAVDNQIQTRVDTGPLSHNLLIGVDFRGTSSRIESFQNAIASLDVFTPTYGAPVTFSSAPSRKADQTLRQAGAYLQDQIRLDRFLLTLSGRHDWTHNVLDNRLAARTTANDSAFTYRAGLTYLSDFGLAPFLSYATSFNLVAGSNAAGEAFKPLTADQLEIGLKYRPREFDAILTLSAFDLTQKNVTTRDPDNPLYQIQTGGIRSRGIEFEAVADLSPSLNVIGSYTFQNVEITNSSVAAELARHPAGIPQHMAKLWLDYRFSAEALEGLRLGGGIRYVGSSFGTPTNRWDFPGYVDAPSKVPRSALVDAAISYDTGNIRLSLNGANLLNTDHFTCIAGTCSHGSGRWVTVSMHSTW